MDFVVDDSPAPEPPEVVRQMSGDHSLTAAELVEVLAHCASITAAAQYRMVMAASLIHEQREEEYLAEIAEKRSGESTIAEMATTAANVAVGIDPRAEFGPDGLERTVAEVGAILTVTPARARELIEAGNAARYRLSFSAHVFATGRIDLTRFLIAIRHTDLCSPEHIVDVDAHIAEALFDRPPMSTTRFTALIDSIVHRFDPDALRRRREHGARDRNVSVRPDRFTPGNARVSGSLPAVEAAVLNARLTEMAAGVHRGDPRTTAQRRADALVALARGENMLVCGCSDCVEHPEAADGDQTTPDQSADDRTTCAPRPTFHIVVNLSTLLGLDNHPGFLDGHGLVDAATVRTLLAEARRSYVTAPTAPATNDGGSSTYVPSRKLAELIRAGELCCTFPGCNAPAWRVDVDHTVPYNHRNRCRGGRTIAGNLKPLCRFHHRIKTFGHWQDYQDDLLAAWFQSPTGHMFFGNCFNGRDLFPGLIPARPADHPARAHLDRRRKLRARRYRNAIDADREANPPPF